MMATPEKIPGAVPSMRDEYARESGGNTEKKRLDPKSKHKEESGAAGKKKDAPGCCNCALL